MKINFLKNVALLAIILGLFSCAKGDDFSRTTGWKYNNKSGTSFEFTKDSKTVAPVGMTYVPGGTFIMGEKTEFVTAQRNSERKKVSVSPFYMDKYEIRNVDWREYSNWMELVFGKVAPVLVERVQPNKDAWRDELAYNEPYLDFYFTHPSYNQYPIVGVSWAQAMDYCVWRTDRINELALIKAGVLAEPDFESLASASFEQITEDFVFNTQKYLLQGNYKPLDGNKPKKDISGQSRKATMNDGLLILDLRLPTEAEWEYAAYAVEVEKDGVVTEGKIYPWGGSQLRKPRGKVRGFNANFVRGRGDYVGATDELASSNVITVAVDSYMPNDFGLYNMAGNVNEWVLDVYRSSTLDDVTEYNPFRGNVFTSPVVKGQEQNGVSNYQIDSLGRVFSEIIDGGDLRNYRDGNVFLGLSSSKHGGSRPVVEQPVLTSIGSSSAAHSGYSYEGQSVADDIRYLEEKQAVQIDVTDVLAPKVSNKTRVYKGGSWKDRAFWLNPSTRRYLDENKSANDIGFRCAMSLIGGDGDSRKK